MSLLLLLLSLVGSSAHASPKDVIAKYGTIEPKRLSVHLQLDPAELDYTGTSKITFEHSRPVEEVVVHVSDGMDLTDVRFVRGTRTWTASVTDLGDEQVAIRPDKPIKVEGMKLPRKRAAERGEPLFATPSFISVEMDFTNQVNESAYGLYRFEHEGEPYLVTQFEADDAREAFPCIDEPDSKVALWMELEVPKDLVALSNSPIRSVDVDEEAGTKTVTFQSTRPIPTYAMALAVGPYESIPIAGMPRNLKGELYTVKGRTELGQRFASEVGPLFHTVEGWFGSPYPYRKLDFLAVPEFAFGGMENPGLVVITDQLLIPPEQATPRNRRWAQEVIAHEIAHMWFGDLVTLKWWDDFWLNESFAEFAGNRTAHLTTGDPGFDLRRVSATQGALQSDGRGTMRPVRTEVDPTRIFETTNFLAYPKGEALLTMVETWLGPEVFLAGVRNYIEAHKDGNATADDLFAALSEASGKDVGGMLGPWLDRPGGPVIHVEIGDGGSLSWKQERYLAAGAEAEAEVWWTTPMVVRWADDAGVHRQVVLADSAEGTATLPVEGELKWLFPHADGIAYMAWTLPTDQLTALIDAAPENLTPAERSALVGNLDLLTTAGHLSGGELLSLLERFSEETHPRVMNDILSAQGFVDLVLEDDEEQRQAWAAYVRATRRPWLDRLGLEPAEDEDEAIPQLRARLIGQLIDPGEDESLKEMLRPIGRAFLEDEAAFDPSLTGMAVRLIAEESEPAFQDELLAKADATDNPQFRGLLLGAFAVVPGIETRDRALAMVVDPETQTNDMWPLWGAAYQEIEGEDGQIADPEDFALDWTMENYEALTAKMPPHWHPRFARTGSGCDEERWERSKAFFLAEERELPGMDRHVREGDELLALCNAAKEAHAESVKAYLEGYGANAAVDAE